MDEDDGQPESPRQRRLRLALASLQSDLGDDYVKKNLPALLSNDAASSALPSASSPAASSSSSPSVKPSNNSRPVVFPDSLSDADYQKASRNAKEEEL